MFEAFFGCIGFVALFGLAYWLLKPKAQRCNLDDVVDAAVSASKQGYSHVCEKWASRKTSKQHQAESPTPAVTQETVSPQLP